MNSYGFIYLEDWNKKNLPEKLDILMTDFQFNKEQTLNFGFKLLIGKKNWSYFFMVQFA